MGPRSLTNVSLEPTLHEWSKTNIMAGWASRQTDATAPTLPRLPVPTSWRRGWKRFVSQDRDVPSWLARIEQTFGHSAAIYHAAGWVIVSYRQNLLIRVATIPRVIRGRPAVG